MPNNISIDERDYSAQIERGRRRLRVRAVRGVSYNLINRTHKGFQS